MQVLCVTCNDAFYILFELQPLYSNVSAALKTYYSNVAASTQHLKAVSSAGMRFSHNQRISGTKFYNFHPKYLRSAKNRDFIRLSGSMYFKLIS